MVSSGSAANLVGVAALFYKGPAAAARGRSDRAGDFVGDHLLSAPAVRAAAAVRRRRARHAEHGRVAARAALTPRTRMVVAVSILGNPVRARRAARVLRPPRALPVRGQLRVDGRGAQRQAVRHLRRHQHFQHLLLPSHLHDGGGRARHGRHRARTISRGRCGRTAGPATCRRTRRSTSKRDDDFFEAYRFILPGYNARPLELAGAVGVEQLKKLDGMVEIRRDERRAVPGAVRGRRALHHPARGTAHELVVLLHDHPEPGARHRPAQRDARAEGSRTSATASSPAAVSCGTT